LFHLICFYVIGIWQGAEILVFFFLFMRQEELSGEDKSDDEQFCTMLAIKGDKHMSGYICLKNTIR